MIGAVFFSRFHPEKGPVVVYQVPDGAILRSTSGQSAPLFDFSALAEFIIPRQEFCDAQLSISTGPYRIVGHPVCISSARYARNEFIFNLALVIPARADAVPYSRIVRRIAQLLREAELSESFLSDDESTHDLPAGWALDSAVGGVYAEPTQQPSRVQAFCEMLMQDLNSYGEAMLPIDTSRVLNATLKSPPAMSISVRAWHVPLAIQDLRDTGAQFGLALRVLAPLIDGNSSISQIARMADADLVVVQKAIASLVAANMVKLLDIFQYGAKYATGPGIRSILHNPAIQKTAAAAVAQRGANVQASHLPILYASLGNGTSLKSWCLEHWSKLEGIDVRHFVAWGLLQRFVYRVHAYAVSLSCTKPEDTSRVTHREAHELTDFPFERYLHGLHCLDCVCTAHHLSPQDMIGKLTSSPHTVMVEK